MLVKLLSGPSIFPKILLFGLFLFLFLIRIQPFPTEPVEIAAIVVYLLIALLLPILFFTSKLSEDSGYTLWFTLWWMLAFWEMAEDGILMAVFLLSLLMFWRIIRAEKRPDNRRYPFTIGLLLSLMFLLWPPAVFLGIFYLFIYLFTREFRFRSFLMFLIGLALPLFMGVQILYLMGNTGSLTDFSVDLNPIFWSSTPWVLLAAAALVVIAWADHLSHLQIQDISKRHIYFLTFIFFWNWVAILVVYAGEHTEMLLFLTAPVTLFMSRFARYLKPKIYRELLLWVWLLICGGWFFREELTEIYISLLGNVAF